MDTPSSARIAEVGVAFRQSKTLLSAVELGLFTALGAAPMTGMQLQHTLGLHPRANPDFFDALVALRFLEREGNGPEARYANTPETALFLDRGRPGYIGRFLEMANDRFYPSWGGLTTALHAKPVFRSSRRCIRTRNVASCSSTRWPSSRRQAAMRWPSASTGRGTGACAMWAARAGCWP
jgi:hypothetical protein